MRHDDELAPNTRVAQLLNSGRSAGDTSMAGSNASVLPTKVLKIRSLYTYSRDLIAPNNVKDSTW